MTQDWPSDWSCGLPSSSNETAASASTCSAVSVRAPMRSSSAIIGSQIAASTMHVCSAGQISEESKVLEISMSVTAMAISALRCT